MTVFFLIGKYVLFLRKVFDKPQKHKIFIIQTLREIYRLGIDSIWIVVIISFFMGAVISLQTGYTFEGSFYPRYLIGFATRKSMILEFSSTVVSLILAGKVGSNIASEIGTMRVSDQIDAMEIMGLNSANFLVLPKVVATMFINPCLYALSVFVGIFGGWLATVAEALSTSAEFEYGLRFAFKEYYIIYSLIKMVVFAFLISSVASFYGYYVKGGALDVGKASTQAVVYSSILILIFNLLLTQLLLR